MELEDPVFFHRTMTISLDHIHSVPSKPDQPFITIIPSRVNAGFAPAEKYPDDAGFTDLPSVFPLTFRPEGWKVIQDEFQLPVTGMMFRSHKEEAFALLLTAHNSGVGVDVFLPENSENLKDLIGKVYLYLMRKEIADRSSSQSQVSHDVCATCRKRFVNYEMVYYVDIKITASKAKPDVFRDRLYLQPTFSITHLQP